MTWLYKKMYIKICCFHLPGAFGMGQQRFILGIMLCGILPLSSRALDPQTTVAIAEGVVRGGVFIGKQFGLWGGAQVHGDYSRVCYPAKDGIVQRKRSASCMLRPAPVLRVMRGRLSPQRMIVGMDPKTTLCMIAFVLLSAAEKEAWWFLLLSDVAGGVLENL